MILNSKEKQVLFKEEINKIEQKYLGFLSEPLVQYFRITDDCVLIDREKRLRTEIEIAIVAAFDKLNGDEH